MNLLICKLILYLTYYACTQKTWMLHNTRNCNQYNSESEIQVRILIIQLGQITPCVRWSNTHLLNDHIIVKPGKYNPKDWPIAWCTVFEHQLHTLSQLYSFLWCTLPTPRLCTGLLVLRHSAGSNGATIAPTLDCWWAPANLPTYSRVWTCPASTTSLLKLSLLCQQPTWIISCRTGKAYSLCLAAVSLSCFLQVEQLCIPEASTQSTRLALPPSCCPSLSVTYTVHRAPFCYCG